MLLLSLFLSAGSSADYVITDKQLQTLELIQQQQKDQLNDLNEQVKSYKQETETLKQYSKALEKQILIKNSIISVSVGVSVGCIAGIITYGIMNR